MKPLTSKNQLPEVLPESLPDLPRREVEVEGKVKEKKKEKLKSALPLSPSGGAGAAASRSSPIPSRTPRDKGNGVEELEISSGFLSIDEELSLMKQDVLRHAFGLSTRGGIEAAIGHLKAAGFKESQISMARELMGARVKSR